MPHVGGAVSDINMLSVRRRTGDVEGEEIRSVVKYYHSPQEGDPDVAQAGGEGGSRCTQRAPVGACQWGARLGALQGDGGWLQATLPTNTVTRLRTRDDKPLACLSAPKVE